MPVRAYILLSAQSWYLYSILPLASKKLHISNIPCNNVYVRNPKGSVVRSLYLVNDNVKAVIKQSNHTKIRLVSAGVKLFGKSALQPNSEKEEEHTTFRVLNEGLPALIPYLNHETLIKGDVKVLRIFLETYYPLCTSFPDDFREQLDKIGGQWFVIN